MAKLSIDGKEYVAKEGENLLHAVLSQSIDLPYFCWHPAMGSVGACRQCAIIQYADEDDTRGRLTMACMTPITDGMRISVEAPHAKDFRTSVIEWLMENHPHDCPVCEEGGECHLQDMTVMTGHSVRKYKNKKRTWQNQDLGPFIGHEMNRCITCYRCVRFYQDYAGGSDLAALGSRDRVFFGRVEPGTLESEFSGNLVEVCPTGVFTDKPFATHYSRKWDLQSAPTICPSCSIGCNTVASERYGLLKRLHNRYNDDVNRYFICDRGRFGSHFVNSAQRIRHVGRKVEEGSFEYGDLQSIIDDAALHITDAVGIGSPRASVEANYALRQLVGHQNFCDGFSDIDHDLLETIVDIRNSGGFHSPSVSEVEEADAILILGEDISNTAARIALAVRQAVRGVSFDMAKSASIPLWQDSGVRGHAQNTINPLYIAVNSSTRLDDIALETSNGSNESIANLGFSIAHEIDQKFANGTSNLFTQNVASALKKAQKPLIISGTGSQNNEVLQAAANIAWALNSDGKRASLLYVVGESNAMGNALLSGNLVLSDALTRMKNGSKAVILENDLYRRADTQSVDDALTGCSHIISLDGLANPTSEKAHVVFPAATYAEQTGTMVNFEGRAQRFFQVFQPKDEIQPSWRWLTALAKAAEVEGIEWESIDELTRSASERTLEGIYEAGADASYRIENQFKVPRQTHRYSGRTAMNANHNIHEPKTQFDSETPFSFSMEGENPGNQKGSTIPYFWSPGWNSNQSLFKFQDEVAGPLKGHDSGKRLVSVDSALPSRASERFRDVPEAISGNGQLQVTPAYSIFGSEELSARSWPIASRDEGPFVRLNPKDAERIGVSENNGVFASTYPDKKFAVIIDPGVAEGTVSMSRGIVDSPHYSSSKVHLNVDPSFQPRPSANERILAKE